MFLRFSANRRVNAKQFGMVQAVRSANAGAPVALNATVGARSITAADATPFPSKIGTDQGFHIDRLSSEASPIYGSMGDNFTQRAYRMFGLTPPLTSSNAPTNITKMTKAQRTAAAAASGVDGVTHQGKGQFGHRFKVGRRTDKQPAELRDVPQLPARGANAEQIFETTVLAIDGAQAGTYYGSVQWGWRSNAKGRFRRLPMKLISMGVPSATFMKSAELWNANPTSTGATTMQLPTVDVHVTTAKTRMNPKIKNKPHTRLRRGTRVQVLNAAEAQPDGRILARIKVVDGSLTGREGLIDPGVLADERP
jgi:hypothetical protein